MNHRISLWREDLGVAGVILASVAAGIIFGKLEAESVRVTAAIERAAQERKADVKPADQLWLRLPLECDQFLAMRGAGEKWKVRTVCADLTKERK